MIFIFLKVLMSEMNQRQNHKPITFNDRTDEKSQFYREKIIFPAGRPGLSTRFMKEDPAVQTDTPASSSLTALVP